VADSASRLFADYSVVRLQLKAGRHEMWMRPSMLILGETDAAGAREARLRLNYVAYDAPSLSLTDTSREKQEERIVSRG